MRNQHTTPIANASTFSFPFGIDHIQGATREDVPASTIYKLTWATHGPAAVRLPARPKGTGLQSSRNWAEC